MTDTGARRTESEQARRSMRAIRRRRFDVEEVGVGAVVAAALLALLNLVGGVAVVFLVVDELQTGATLGETGVVLLLVALGAAVLALVGVAVGTWLRRFWMVAAVFVLYLLGVVFQLASTSTVSPFGLLAAALAAGLLYTAWTRWPVED